MKRTTLFTALLLATELVSVAQSFSTNPQTNRGSSSALLASARAESDFDANRYNVPLDEAVDLWTASIQESNNADRMAGVPYVDSKSKEYFVDGIVSVEVPRDGGSGIELLELAGGRDDGIGITIVSSVTKGGNAENAGIIAGDSIASITVYEKQMSSSAGLVEETKSRVRDCEA